MASLRKEYNVVLNNKHFLEQLIDEKDRLIKQLESRAVKEVEIPKSKSSVHDAKLAIHSCLSVANVFMQKYNDIASKGFTDRLNESIYNLNKYDNIDQIVQTLKPLEEWINIVCKELEVIK
jgi:hypothetical protein